MKLLATFGAAVLAVAFNSPISATAETQSCVSSDTCIWVAPNARTEADYELINAELTAILASLQSGIVGTNRDDKRLTELLHHGTQMCELAKCKSNKGACAEIFRLYGLHLYLQQEYVPPLISLEDLQFATDSTMTRLLN